MIKNTEKQKNKSEESSIQRNKKHMIHQNNIWQIICKKPLSKENFSLYQKDIEYILLQLTWQTNSIHLQIETILNQKEKREEYLRGTKKQCALLKEYCNFFSQQIENTSLPYRHLAETCHKTKILADNIEQFIVLYDEEKDWEKQNQLAQTIKDAIQDSIETNLEEIKKINTIKFKKESLENKDIFYPFEKTTKETSNHLANIEKKHIRITNNIPKQLKIKSYKDIFMITINNLLSNAIKFSPEKWEIKIEIQEQNPQKITFSIKNSWEKITKDEKIFNLGYSKKSEKNKTWTGLGLNQCKVFLENIQWEIHYTTDSEWTVFYFTLPQDKIT